MGMLITVRASVLSYSWSLVLLSAASQVIGHLLSQRTRSELLSMLYEVELRRHRETHRLLSASHAQLTRWREGRESRTVSSPAAAVGEGGGGRLAVASG